MCRRRLQSRSPIPRLVDMGMHFYRLAFVTLILLCVPLFVIGLFVAGLDGGISSRKKSSDLPCSYFLNGAKELSKQGGHDEGVGVGHVGYSEGTA